MALGVTLGATTATSQVLNFTGTVAGDLILIQYGVRADFQWTVAPSFSIPQAASYTLQQLNAGTVYYVRARRFIDATQLWEAWQLTLSFQTSAGSARDLSVPAVMIDPAILVVPNPILQWIAASSVAGYGPENLSYDAPVAWRSNHATTHLIDLRMGPEPVDTIALLMSNAPESATVQVTAGATQGASTYNSGSLAFRASPNLPSRRGYHCLLRLPAAQRYIWWRVTIFAICPGNTFHLEHAIFGASRITKNHSVDKVETPVDLGRIERNRAGIPDRQTGWRGRRVDFDISMLTELQYENTYADLGEKVGNTEPVLVVPNAKAGAYLHDRILYGPIVGQKAVNPASPRYTRSFTIDSIV